MNYKAIIHTLQTGTQDRELLNDLSWSEIEIMQWQKDLGPGLLKQKPWPSYLTSSLSRIKCPLEELSGQAPVQHFIPEHRRGLWTLLAQLVSPLCGLPFCICFIIRMNLKFHPSVMQRVPGAKSLPGSFSPLEFSGEKTTDQTINAGAWLCLSIEAAEWTIKCFLIHGGF